MDMSACLRLAPPRPLAAGGRKYPLDIAGKHESAVESDAELINALRRQDTTALEKLYDRHSARMLGAAMRILNNRGDAEDLLHDVFVEAWQNVASYDPRRGSPLTWLLTRLRSRAIDRLRSLELARRHAMAAPPRVATIARADSDGVAGRCRAAMASLSQAQRTVLELGYYRGLTCSEIAVHCDLPIGTVKSRLSAALANLRGKLTPQTEHD